jgi:HK97 family phage major capsid protein
MASVTLAESAKLTLNQLHAGIIEAIVDVNPIYEVMPFQDIEGNALAYNRENALGDVQFLGVDGTITAKNPATFIQVTSTLTTLIGDAEVNGLIQATRSNMQDQTAIQIGSKAKSLGRKYQQNMITGDGTGDTFPGLLTLVPAGQILPSATNGQNLTFDILDMMIDGVKDKDGQVDYFMMPARTIRAYYALLRAAGGATISDIMELPSGRKIPMYRGVPMFRNDYIPVNQTKGAATTCTSIFAGTFDDGSQTHGIAGLSAQGSSGIRVVKVGESETKDNTITRVKMYCGMALYSELGIIMQQGILN